MKKILLFIITISITFIMCGCGKEKKYNYKLTVSSNSWSGWVADDDYQGDHVDEEFLIKKDTKYTVRKNHSFSFSFKVTKITKDGITIKTNDALISDGNMAKLEYEFFLELDKDYIFTSPTYDAGCTYYLKLQEA